MKNEHSVEAFRALASQAGMCPAEALLDPEETLRMTPQEPVGAADSEPVGHQPWQLPKRQMLECVCTGPSVGGQSLLESLIRAPWESGLFRVLIDAANSLDPNSFDPEVREHLLWVRVSNTTQLVRALDLLLRDDNFALVAADMRGLSTVALQSIQPFVWYRLQRLAHQRAGGCVIFSDTPSVRCADRRVRLSACRVLEDLDRTRVDLLASLEGSICFQTRGQLLAV